MMTRIESSIGLRNENGICMQGAYHVDDLFALQDPRRMNPVGPSEGATALLIPKLEVETNAVPATGLSAANAQTAALNLESASNVPTNLRDPRATFHLHANHRPVGPAHVQVKQEPKQEPIEAENLGISDAALPLSPPPQPGIPLAQGMATTMLSKLLINIHHNFINIT